MTAQSEPAHPRRGWTIPAGTAPARLDKLLAAAFPEHSRTALRRCFDSGKVWLDGVPAKPALRAGPGRRVEYELEPVRPAALHPVEMPLAILFEDEHLLVLDKPPGIVVHPGAGNREHTLVHALLAHCRGQLSGVGGEERPGIVHRLDRGTSGAMVVAKHDRAHRGLARQFAERRGVEKDYGAIVQGLPPGEQGTIEDRIGRHAVRRHLMAVTPSGREARTDWKVLERLPGRHAWVECRIHTGRTHQVRVHLQSIRLPIVGDPAYGWKPDPRLDPPPKRVLLHARRLRFLHPVTRRVIEALAPWPADFLDALARLRRLPG